MSDRPHTPKPISHTHALGPGARLAEVAETVHEPGECSGCSEPYITENGYVYPDINKAPIGRVRRTRWSRGRTWEALDANGRPINIPGRNMAFPNAEVAAAALVEVSR